MIDRVIFCVCFVSLFSFLNTETTYQPTWDSLDSRPLPQWYDNDKFGIFIHWGVFSVPAMGEWFWYNWKVYNSTVAIKFMNENFKPNFTYQDFGRDFTAGFFNVTEWVTLFKQSGARYIVLTSKHHEGYTLWPSKYSFSWNSVDVGPHRDIITELANALRSQSSIKFGLYHSLYEWFNPLYLDDKKNNFTTSRFVDFKTGAELYELVELFKPDVIWSDGEWEASDDYWKAKQFLAWLYNESPVKDTVVVNDRWGANTLCKHGGFLTCTDRYNPGIMQTRKWENAMTIDKYSWGYRRKTNLEDYWTTYELVQQLVSTVSYGGNLLMNVAPTSDGKIPPIYQERLEDIGKWLAVNGEGIYETKPWQVCQNDTVAPSVWYTTKNDTEVGDVLYIIFAIWPKTSKIVLQCVKSLKPNSKAELLNQKLNVKWTTTVNDSTEFELPNKAFVDSEWAWTIKLINGTNALYRKRKPINVSKSRTQKYSYTTV